MEVLEQVVTMISAIMGKEKAEIKAEDKFVETLDMDDLDTTELILGLEDTFGISIDEEEIEKLATVQDLVNYVTEKIKKESGNN